MKCPNAAQVCAPSWPMLVICLVALASPMWAQSWVGGPSGPIYYNGGNVGIGASAPLVQLHISGNGGVTQFIETTGTGFNWLQFRNRHGMTYAGQLDSADFFFVNTHATGKMHLGTNNLAQLTLTPAGNVGIGTSSPQYPLSVNGVIGAKDVIVTNSGWSDYVFRPDYRLKPLSEVDAFIRAHRHLPEIPSEAEVQAQGINVGEMQAKLLAKIEELTLHLIRQEKENGELRERVLRLESRAGER